MITYHSTLLLNEENLNHDRVKFSNQFQDPLEVSLELHESEHDQQLDLYLVK